MAKQKEAETKEKPYLTEPGNYNHESGTKTLRLVAVMIFLIAAFAIVSLVMIYK